MNFTVSQKSLATALARVAKVVPQKNPIPVLTHVLFELNGDALRLTGSNLEQTVVSMLKVSGKKNGAAAFPADKILKLVQSLPEVDLAFTLTEKLRLTVKTSSGEYHIAGDSAEEFPRVQEVVNPIKFELDAEVFVRSVAAVKFAASTDESRQTLMGMLLDLRPEEIRFVATDGHRLSRVIVAAKTSTESAHFIIPITALKLLEQSIDSCDYDQESGKPVLFSEFTPDYAKFVLGRTCIYSKLIVGKYPNYELILPQDNNVVITDVGTDDLTSMLRRNRIFANEITSRVDLIIGPGRVEVEAQQEQTGNFSREQIAVSFDTETGDLRIGCNVNYMIESITHLDAERITLRFKDQASSILLEPTMQRENEQRLMLLAPIRMDK